jgi:hypothetical protein
MTLDTWDNRSLGVRPNSASERRVFSISQRPMPARLSDMAIEEHFVTPTGLPFRGSPNLLGPLNQHLVNTGRRNLAPARPWRMPSPTMTESSGSLDSHSDLETRPTRSRKSLAGPIGFDSSRRSGSITPMPVRARAKLQFLGMNLTTSIRPTFFSAFVTLSRTCLLALNEPGRIYGPIRPGLTGAAPCFV